MQRLRHIPRYIITLLLVTTFLIPCSHCHADGDIADTFHAGHVHPHFTGAQHFVTQANYQRGRNTTVHSHTPSHPEVCGTKYHDSSPFMAAHQQKFENEHFVHSYPKNTVRVYYNRDIVCCHLSLDNTYLATSWHTHAVIPHIHFWDSIIPEEATLDRAHHFEYTLKVLISHHEDDSTPQRVALQPQTLEPALSSFDFISLISNIPPPTA